MVIELFRRFPSVRLRATSRPVLPATTASDHPELADDLRVVEQVLAGPFEAADLEALTLQNAHRRRSVVVLLGSALLTGLGALQAAYAHQTWPGVVLGVLAALVAATSRIGVESGTAQRHLSARLQAEQLRALHLRYLARTAPFDAEDDGQRRRALERAVVEIGRGEEPA
jgi:hypothetical protein